MNTARKAKVPGVYAWAALCSALMRCELALEALEQDLHLTDEKRASALRKCMREIAHEPAYAWLARQPGFVTALRNFTARVSDDEADRFDFIAGVCYALEKLHSDAGDPDAPSRETLSAAAAHAEALLEMMTDHGANGESMEADAQLKTLLRRYAGYNAMRAAGAKADYAVLRQTYAGDVAHLLLAGFGKAPADVVKPLLMLVGYEPAPREVARVLASVKAGATSRKRRASAARKRPYVLDRILIEPTAKSRRRQKA